MHDPSAAIARFAVEFTLAGRDFVIPALPASRWLNVLLGDDLFRLVAAHPHGLLPEDQAVVIDGMLLDGELDIDELRGALRDVIGVASGRDWWEAAGLVAAISTESNWARLHGQMVFRGLDASKVSLAAWLNAAFFAATQHMDAKQYGRFVGHLRTPPPDVGLDEEREGATFLALMNGG